MARMMSPAVLKRMMQAAGRSPRWMIAALVLLPAAVALAWDSSSGSPPPEGGQGPQAVPHHTQNPELEPVVLDAVPAPLRAAGSILPADAQSHIRIPVFSRNAKRPALLPVSAATSTPLRSDPAVSEDQGSEGVRALYEPQATKAAGKLVSHVQDEQVGPGSPESESSEVVSGQWVQPSVRLAQQPEATPPEAAPSANRNLEPSPPAGGVVQPGIVGAPENVTPGWPQPAPGPFGGGAGDSVPGHFPPALPYGPPPPGFVPHGAVEDHVIAPFEIIDYTEELTVTMRRSKLMRFNVDIYRVAVADQTICNVNYYTKREIGLIGLNRGATTVTFWFDDGHFRPRTFLVRVQPDPEVQKQRDEQYQILEQILAQQFPNSKVRLKPRANKLIVEGEAYDSAEAAQILAIIRNDAEASWQSGGAFRGGLFAGAAADPLTTEEIGRRLPPTQVINMLRVPGVQQVALRVKVAELNRSAARRAGLDFDLNFNWDDGQVVIQSLLNAATGGTATILGSFDDNDLNFGLHYLQEHGVIRLLSEPTVVVMSGMPASFVAGGEFAVPTTVGVAGAAAVTTDFRAYGAIVTVLPTVIDKDLVRLQVSPEFSQINNDLTVNNIPSLNTRSVNTTVQMREGQTLAIGGLLSDSQVANLRGTIPFIWHLIGRRSVTRSETELIILVTPELVQPMEPEEVPPLPGFDVTEPTDPEFFLHGHLEGLPTHEHRSTVWPRLTRRYQGGGPAMISGPFGHGQ